MGKRKHKDSYSREKKKRKYKKRARHESDSDSSSTDEHPDYFDYNEYHRRDTGYEYPEEYENISDDQLYDLPSHDSDASLPEHRPRSVVTGNALPKEGQITEQTEETPQPGPSTAPASVNPDLTVSTIAPEAVALPPEILEALGDPKGKEEVFGPKIPEEIAKRWGRVLVDGLTKEKKQEITEKTQIPDNFRLTKAPLLNPEIIPVLSEPARNRDKLLEKSQNQLGLGIAKLTYLASSIIEGNTDKIELLKQISETSQVFLDLHYEDTKRRRKLVTSSLDKKFLHMINDVKRDTHLFGVNLGDKIKASKTAERSGLQIKRTDATASSSKKYPQSGNWRGPPRAPLGQRAYRQGGQRNRYWSQPPNRRPPPPAARPPPRAPAKQGPQTSKAQ